MGEYDEYVSAQESALAALVQENKQIILETVTGWLGGPWAAVAAWLLGSLIDQCTDVDKKNRTFVEQLRTSVQQNLGRFQAMTSRACPSGVQLIPNEVKVEASEIGQPFVVPVVLACDQEITLRYDLLGHAASPCHQDAALAWLIGSSGGQGTVVWSKQATGIARLFDPESVRVAGEERIRLQSGGYALLVAVTGDYSTASASAQYASVPAPPPLWSRPWVKATAAGVGAGVAAAAVAGLAVRG